MQIADEIALAGCVALTLGGAGLLALREAAQKVHATSFMLAAGTLLSLLAAALSVPEELAPRASLVGLFLLTTTPVAAQALLRFAKEEGAAQSAPPGGVGSTSQHVGSDQAHQQDDEGEADEGGQSLAGGSRAQVHED